MLKYATTRVLTSIPLVVGVSVLAFLLIHLVPGDPVRLMLGPHASQQSIAELNSSLGLDRPLWEQYASFLSGAARFDFGRSISQRTPVSEMMLERSVPTVLLLLYAAIIAVAISVPLALAAALRHNRVTDQVVRVLAGVAVAMPVFWTGLVLAFLVSYRLGLLPTSGYAGSEPLGVLPSLTLPALTIALYLCPVLIRSIRSSVLETREAAFVTSMHARGLSERRVLLNHVLRNSVASTIIIMGVMVSYLISGAVVVENVFGIPGIGSLLVSAIEGRDFPVIMGIVVVLGVFVILVNLAADLVHAALDPRIRL